MLLTYMEEIVQNKEPLSEWQIKNLYRLVLKGIDDENAGVYRDQQIFIADATYTPPPHYLIQDKMEYMMNWYQGQGTYLHPVERGAVLHAIFVGILDNATLS